MYLSARKEQNDFNYDKQFQRVISAAMVNEIINY